MTTDAKTPEDSRLNLTDLLSALRSLPWCYDEGGQQFSYAPAELAEQAAKAIERLRLERDVLALNAVFARPAVKTPKTPHATTGSRGKHC